MLLGEFQVNRWAMMMSMEMKLPFTFLELDRERRLRAADGEKAEQAITPKTRKLKENPLFKNVQDI